jgi:uncharacterized repeat protein (TIGR01451 family)
MRGLKGRTLRNCIAQIRVGFFIVLGALAVQANDARAAVDWVVNVSDAGFDPTPAGGAINYSVSVTNNGFSAAPATTIELDIPDTGSLISFSGTITACAPVPSPGPSTVTCAVPALASGETATLSARVRASEQGAISLQATVPPGGDAEPGNNSASQLTTITAGSNLRLRVSGPATAASGSFVSLAYEVTNLGPDISTSFTFSFPIPTGLTNFSIPGGCSLSGTIYTCTFSGSLALNASFTYNFTAQVSAAATSTITAIGSVSGNSPPDPIAGNNSASQNISVTGGTDVRIGMSRAPSGTLLVGNSATFTIDASYTGDSPNGLVIENAVPSNYSITSVTPAVGSGWTCAVSGQNITCNRATGAGAGANISLGSIEVVTDVVAAGNVANTATISAAGPNESNLSNNSASDGGATLVTPVVDFRANKSGPNNPALVVVGSTYDFQISATNDGNAPFIGTVVLTDSLPVGLQVTSVSDNGWSCSPGTPVAGPASLVCQRDYVAGSPLVAGASTPTITLSALVTAPGNLNNVVAVSSPNANFADNNAANDSASYSVSSGGAAASADITINKTASLASLPAGGVLSFQIELVNNGPATANSITLTDDLAPLINDAVGATGAGFVSSSIAANVATGSSCSSASSGGFSRRLTCTFATLPVCTARSNCPVITVAVRPGGDGGGRTNTASAISNATGDPVLGNNSASINYAVEARADVTVAKAASPSPAIAGQDVTYVITATNIANGLSAADNVTVTDTLPSNLVFVSASPSSGSCSATPALNSTTSIGNNQVVCNLGTINNGAQSTLSIVVRPRTSTRGTSLGNGVIISTTTAGDVAGNNSATINTTVQAPVLDVLVNNDDSADPVAVGDNMTYLLSVTNNGPSAAENVVITDTLPNARLSYQSFTIDADGTCATVPTVNVIGGTLQCSFPLLPAGETRQIIITMRGETKGVTSNSVTITSTEIAAGFDTLAINNNDVEHTTVRSRADLEVVSKIPSVAAPNLREDFDFVIRIRNNVGAGLSDADDAILSDTLPAGMQLAGTPVAVVTSGSSSQNSCTGTAGAASFTCNFGTMDNGAEAQITVPVEIVSVSSAAQAFTNTATVATSSFDPVPGNDSNSGVVNVNSSSITGTVFRDFADDASLNAIDTGISNLTMTLACTTFDNANITRTTDTGNDGTYRFDFIPQGTCAITRGIPSEPGLVPGTNTPGSEGGTLSGATRIVSIALPSNTAATGYDFAMVPRSGVGITKIFTNPTTAADGSYSVTWQLEVTNFSLEGLDGVTVTDTLAGAAPSFGTFVTLVAPSTDPLADGQYTLVASPNGTCGGNNGGYTGVGANTTVASGFSIAAGTSCTINFTLRAQPTEPLPPIVNGGRYNNQAIVTAVGSLSGQTSADNPQLRDLSNDVANPDPNGNSIANEAGENNPTAISPDLLPAIALVKSGTLDDSNSDGFAEVGETITYTFRVRNTGNVDLRNVSVTDPLITVVGGPIARLNIGSTNNTTFTGTYVLTAADIAAGRVDNTASVTGRPPAGPTVSDVSDSDDPADGPNPSSFASGVDNDDPTIVLFTPRPIDANDDTRLGVVGLTGESNVLNVYSNDTLAGALADPTNVTLTVDPANPVPPELTFDPATGFVSVKPNTAVGTYDFRYTICSIADPTLCSTALVTITTVAPLATVSGTVFRDNNGNGVLDPRDNDAGSGYRVSIVDSDGNQLASTVTDANGFYEFEVSPGNDYRIIFRNAAGRVIGGILDVDVPPGGTVLNQNQPIDPAGVVYNSVTRIPVPGVTVTITTVTGTPLPGVCLIDPSQQSQRTDATGEYNFDLVPGADAACPAGQTTYGLSVSNPENFKPGLSKVLRPQTNALDVAACSIDAVPGGSCQVSGSPTAPGEGGATIYFTTFTLGTGSPDLVNNHLPIDPLLVAPPDRFTKTASTGTIRRGDSVTYTIEAVGVSTSRADIVDVVPVGFTYVRNSARVNGRRVAPVIDARDHAFNAVEPDAQGRIRITLKLIASAAVTTGQHVNRAILFDPGTGQPVAEAKATVTVVPEHIFDCSDILGKVFDDKNRNGYQDEGEAGLPGVRLATVKGLLVTADKFGRFHVGCGEIPDSDIGSNFIMKVDTRTLPSGYRMTTENPRTIRVTRGKASKINFGAAITRVVKLDLNPAVFVSGTNDLKPKWREGIDELVRRLEAEPSVLRIQYYAGSASERVAKARLRAIEVLVGEAWAAEEGRYKLPIESRVIRTAGAPNK